MRETRNRVPLLLADIAALQILLCARAAARLGAAMAEAGVLKGGSARLICAAKGGLPLHLFDVFDALQTAEGKEADARELELRGHFRSVHGSREEVEQLLAPYREVHVHQGIFPMSARGLEHLRFSFVHVDLDLHASTLDALRFFHPRLVPGGILIGDDYNDPGVKRAFKQHFEGRPDTLIEFPWGQVMVVKQPDAAGSADDLEARALGTCEVQ